ncbi:MAG: alpha/beta fold hydrolase [Pigmentiphaga sp.]|uniref:alpha/beta fold hydrolase n=1 Tax=Pigmentiphaga sp. TaxID=1977564 RepID=UPI0029A44AE8|nr:alpha/beta fold hydrolase [Pigmentiphaga sp.]MDX3907010.1 alpha/beta fold hydrolase [Pigmentiphaga sp.]
MRTAVRARAALLACPALIAALLSAGCGGGDDPVDRKNQAATTVPVAAPDWQACETLFPGSGVSSQVDGDRYECAVIKVPLDYADPGGKTVDLALRRRPAGDAAGKIGSLVIEPGGPGGSGVAAVPDFVSKLSEEVRRKFDIVGFDPRGVGLTRPSGAPPGSAALPCGGALAEYFSHDLADTGAAASQALDAAAAGYAETCRDDAIFPFMGTMNVVRDVEVLRRTVGDAKLTYLGVSYGTEVGIVYADMYPSHVRAMIIDGVVNPAQSGDTILVNQAISWERGLREFFSWCAAQADVNACAIRDDPEGKFKTMLAQAHAAPANMDYHGRPIPLSTGWLTLISALSMYGGDPAGYQGIATAIGAAVQTPPDWTVLAAAASAQANTDSLGPAVWTTCMDQPLPGGIAFESIVARAAAEAPLTGAVQANINRPCAHLPVPADPVPTNYKAAGSPPIMVWGTTGDPATPLQSSIDVVAQLDNASLFVFEANQHVAMGGGPGKKACVVDVQSDYLLTAKLVPQASPCDGR